MDCLQIKKLYYLTKPMYLGVIALAWKSKDVDSEAKGQRAVVKAENQRSGGQKD